MPIDHLGRELKDLRVSVTDRCNFRCQFCMPEGENYEFFRREEILSFVRVQGVGLSYNQRRGVWCCVRCYAMVLSKQAKQGLGAGC